MFYALDCCPDESKKQHREVEKKLRDLNKQYKKEIKLLLLGTGESGKSTFVRQMRILYDNGYTNDQRKNYIKLIHENVYNSMRNMIQAMDALQIKYEKEKNATTNASLFKLKNTHDDIKLDDIYSAAIKELWEDSGIQECYKRRREYQLNDSTFYYISRLDSLTQPDYLPDNQDILRVRIRTVGLIEHKFEANKVIFHITDVGGQRSQRRKWKYCFEDVRAIIFLVAISEYDQVLMEDGQSNRLKESYKVLKEILSDFRDQPVILFLNKTDILHEKIKSSHLDEYFPEFKGPRCDAEAAKEFIADMFEGLRPGMYYHFTCATDTENIQVVFTAVRDIILNKRLENVELD